MEIAQGKLKELIKVRTEINWICDKGEENKAKAVLFKKILIK